MTMHDIRWLEILGPPIAVAAPLIGGPLTLMVLYLRTLRDEQRAWTDFITRRIDLQEQALDALRQTVSQLACNYTTREEWLRETIQTRHALENLRDRVIRLDTVLHGHKPSPAEPSPTGSESPLHTA